VGVATSDDVVPLRAARQDRQKAWNGLVAVSSAVRPPVGAVQDPYYPGAAVQSTMGG